MKKTLLILTILTIVVLSLSIFMVGCDKTKTEETEAEGKEAILQNVKDLVAGTKESTNYVFTLTEGNDSVVITRDGDKLNNDDKRYAFKGENDSKRVAIVSSKTIYVSDSNYDNAINSAMTGLSSYTDAAVESMPDTLEFKDKKVVTTKKKETTVTYDLTIKGTYTAYGHTSNIDIAVHAISKNGLIETITLTQKMEGQEDYVVTLSFVYGNASVTLPDFADYNVITS